MGLELELSSELAALRPIRVTALPSPPCIGSSTSRPDYSGSPEESGSATVRLVVVVGGVGASVSAAAAPVVESSDGCVTPTSAGSALRPATVCPPAPRKPRPAGKRMTKRCCCGGGGGGRPRRPFFPVPHDLAAVFVARAPAATTSPPCPPPAKKIRVHAVG
ncbi:hypothetical protein OsI_23988 [Oryza sativa Indica Group]|uniref:Uncharacterized protein n=1 Tax=Oryza sativa subsp. indica TaxID=39946 RepID=A2YFU6_ORYSI|nr:hypothetical protein OsI_23988 [Oryza sativa Indica Group]